MSTSRDDLNALAEGLRHFGRNVGASTGRSLRRLAENVERLRPGGSSPAAAPPPAAPPERNPRP